MLTWSWILNIFTLLDIISAETLNVSAEIVFSKASFVFSKASFELNFFPFHWDYLDKLLDWWLKCYFVLTPSVLLLLADDGCNNDHSPARCSGGGGLVWVLVVTRAVWPWWMETERPPANWATCDIVWCCVMLCHKHTTFCHPTSRSTSSHLDTGTLEVWSSSQLLLSMGQYLILQI